MDKKIQSICDDYYRNKNFSGVCYIRKKETVIFEQAYGFAHRGFHILNTVETMFDTASVTKVFTAAAVLLLAEKGLLKLQDKITDVIDLSGTKIPKDVTIAHLLTHTSGIADDADEEAGERYSDLFIHKPNYSIRSTGDFLSQFAFKEPLFSAGTNVRYNNCAFILLGLAIEKISGQDYRSFVSSHIFTPLGMENTRFCAMDEVNENTAEGYIACYDEKDIFTGWKKNIYSYPPVGSPDGGVYTTARDLDLFIRKIQKGNLLNQEYTKMLLEPHCQFSRAYSKWAPMAKLSIRNGYAFEFMEADGEVFCIRKDGMNDGVAAMLSYYPEYDISVMILCNQDCNIWQMHREIQTLLYYDFHGSPAAAESPDNIENIVKKY